MAYFTLFILFFISLVQSQENNKINSPVKAVVKQPLLDVLLENTLPYVNGIGSQIHIDELNTTENVDYVGKVNIDFQNLRVTSFSVKKDKSHVILRDGNFIFLTNDVEVIVSFDWHWYKGILGDRGQGELQLLNGNIGIQFKVEQEKDGQLLYVPLTVDQNFDKVSLVLKANHADWLYQVILKILQNKIRQNVESKIQDIFELALPPEINEYMAMIPREISIEKVPFKNSFNYTVKERNYILVEGYEQVEYYKIRKHQKLNPLQARSHIVQLPRVVKNPVLGTQTLRELKSCTPNANQFKISNQDVIDTPHMVHTYLHQSFPGCVSNALFEEGKLTKTIKNGDIPNIVLISDLFSSLIPGIQKDYPGKPMEIILVALEAPKIKFLNNSKVRAEVKVFENFLVVNDGKDLNEDLVSQDRKIKSWWFSGAKQQPRVKAFQNNESSVEVLKMEMQMNITATIHYDMTRVASIQVQHKVLDSKYDVSPTWWNYATRYIVGSYGNRFKVKQYVQKYLNTNINKVNLTITDPEINFNEEWAQVLFDVVVS